MVEIKKVIMIQLQENHKSCETNKDSLSDHSLVGC